ncbi:MAG: methyltransferase domain-containing protein [Acidobacteriaceae bacterium]|jgi:SAM-dependent methyltransferase|nr:methyltransferase domain-containing protein [Acidobacteriaceae bacterium]
MISKLKAVPFRLDAASHTDLPRVLGQTEAALHPGPPGWLQASFGFFDIHTRQKWTLLRPLLGGLPRRGLRLLDAGCGTGRWALELAARRPQWKVTGIDQDQHSIAEAQVRARRLGFDNVSFEAADFLDYVPPERVDVLLSIASAHYLARAGKSQQLFSRFADWLAPGGTLLLYGPREPEAIPTMDWLPPLTNDWGFARLQLLELCRGHGLETALPGAYGLFPVIGRAATMAKQLAIATDRTPLLRALAYPAVRALGSVGLVGPRVDEPSSAWLLVARRSGA